MPCQRAPCADSQPYCGVKATYIAQYEYCGGSSPILDSEGFCIAWMYNVHSGAQSPTTLVMVTINIVSPTTATALNDCVKIAKAAWEEGCAKMPQSY